MPDDLTLTDLYWLRETSNAIRVQRGRSEPVWLPKSQIRDMRILRPDSRGDLPLKITIPSWLAREKNLVG